MPTYLSPGVYVAAQPPDPGVVAHPVGTQQGPTEPVSSNPSTADHRHFRALRPLADGGALRVAALTTYRHERTTRSLELASAPDACSPLRHEN